MAADWIGKALAEFTHYRYIRLCGDTGPLGILPEDVLQIHSTFNESVKTANGDADNCGRGTWELTLATNGASHLLMLPRTAYCPDLVVSVVLAYCMKEIGVCWRTAPKISTLTRTPQSLTPKLIGNTISQSGHFIIQNYCSFAVYD